MIRMGRPTHDLSGQRFGALTPRFPTQIGVKMHWISDCECGNECVVYAYSLLNGAATSCGCRRTARIIAQSTKHGNAQRGRSTGEYRSWQRIWQRCTNPRTPGFENYGGRGISVCDRWLDFTAFLEDMGPKPAPEYTIERKDNDGDYAPDNCMWATRREQSRNRRNNVQLTARGETLVMQDWAARTGISISTIAGRLARGWSVEDAVLTPAQHSEYKQRQATKAYVAAGVQYLPRAVK